MFASYGFVEGQDYTSDYTTIEMDSKPFQVRYHIIDSDQSAQSEKPILVLMHCYMHSSASAFVQFFKYLTPTYRVVCFDNCGWGLNSRSTGVSALQCPISSEEWLLDQTRKTIDSLTFLPDKFLLAGHSMGGYLASLYAS